MSDLALPGIFAALVGVLYTIDNVFPYGEFTPFQILVPTTATLAAKTLNWMGCVTSMTTVSGMPTLQATGPLGTAKFSIAWPCAGIESFLIFTAVVLVFLQQIHISWKAKMGYFVVGVVVTYFINVTKDCYHFQHRHAVRSKFKPGADVPLLLRTALLDNMDCVLSAYHFRKPRLMAQNKNWESSRMQPLRNSTCR